MYRLAVNSIIRLADNAAIPLDTGNADYQAYLAWVADDNTPAAIAQDGLVSVYTAGLQTYLDSTAQAHGYDSIYTAALRAGFPGPFQAEGLAFAQWMDACWTAALAILADVEAEIRPLPTLADVISELPELVL